MKTKPIKKTTFGATVLYCGHRAVFVADIFVVENAAVVRASGAVTMNNVIREPQAVESATHHVSDHLAGFWRPELGVFVVPTKACRVLTKATGGAR